MNTNTNTTLPYETHSDVLVNPSTVASNKKHSTKHPVEGLATEYDCQNKWEIGIDEAGRGPLFGRLYVAGVILPKCNIPQSPAFRHQDMKDSKKFHSSKKIKEVSSYIKQHALAWHIHYISEQTIDQINIRQAVLRAMQECAKQCIYKLQSTHVEMVPEKDVFLLIDGNDFVSCPMFDETRQTIIEIPHKTFEGGDNTFTAIAAASILAKVARDEYIEQLCIEYPELDVRYGISKNKGYGTKTHLDGIRTHGICEWHRRSYGICKTERMNPITAGVDEGDS